MGSDLLRALQLSSKVGCHQTCIDLADSLGSVKTAGSSRFRGLIRKCTLSRINRRAHITGESNTKIINIIYFLDLTVGTKTW